MTAAPTQVYVVTSGCYSAYAIDSVWLTVEEAEVAASKLEPGYCSDPTVEVWPVGEHKRTLGKFTRSGKFNADTGELIFEQADDSASLYEESVELKFDRAWKSPDGLNDTPECVYIFASAPTRERADKVYSEVRARVLADISLGLPAEVIASKPVTP
jgi:hypothetical protein